MEHILWILSLVAAAVAVIVIAIVNAIELWTRFVSVRIECCDWYCCARVMNTVQIILWN